MKPEHDEGNPLEEQKSKFDAEHIRLPDDTVPASLDLPHTAEPTQ